MIYWFKNDKILYILLIITCNSFVEHGSALKVEEIIGGDPTWSVAFPYQAAILGKYNFTHHIYLICSASIIADYFLISAARCFVHSSNQLKKFTFYAVVGETIITAKQTRLYEIGKIYMYDYDASGHRNNLAVTKLKISLNLASRANLAILQIPQNEEFYHGKEGIVSGYGKYAVNNSSGSYSHAQIRLRAKNGQPLQFAPVVIISDGNFRAPLHSFDSADAVCREKMYPFIDLCGIIPLDQRYPHRGVCSCDYGSPLVFNNTIIGIVSTHNADCNDSLYGIIYTKVVNLKNFIGAILQERPVLGMTIYHNAPHVPYSRLRHGERS